MKWRLSRFRTSDLVEIRSKEEILASLDQHGRLDGMPFMPEMLQFCGQRVRVRAVAHKTCDTARQTYKGRRLQAAVHLDDLRCDGSAHGGCQAECSLFWKDAWLKPVGENGSGSAKSSAGAPKMPSGGCTGPELYASTRLASSTDAEESRYSCQATQLYDFTEPLPTWDVRQYVFDVVTGNHSVGRVVRVVWLGWLRWLVPRVPRGYRLVKSFTDWMHLWLTGRPAPSARGQIKHGQKTPTDLLELKPGELIRIKSQEEIEHTLDENCNNRGLSFDKEEMVPYCGRVARVRARVTKIIEEPTGRMLQMMQPCIILEGVVCQGEFASCRLNCPRAIPPYWREIWLERVEHIQQSSDEPKLLKGE